MDGKTDEQPVTINCKSTLGRLHDQLIDLYLFHKLQASISSKKIHLFELFHIYALTP